MHVPVINVVKKSESLFLHNRMSHKLPEMEYSYACSPVQKASEIYFILTF